MLVFVMDGQILTRNQLEIGNWQLAINDCADDGDSMPLTLRAIVRFLLAICRTVRTLATHEACQAIPRHYIFAGLLCRDWRGTGPFAGRSNGQSDPARFHQHSKSG